MGKDIKLLQLSNEWCGPCRMARSYISENYDTSNIGYRWVDLDTLKEDDIHFNVVTKVRPRSVPTFVVIDDKNKEILESWTGHSIPKVKGFIEKYKS